MPVVTRRTARAAAAGAAASVLYLAAAHLGSRRISAGVLFLGLTAAVAGVVTSGRASAKAYVVESRFNNLLSNGGTFGGNVTVGGDHTVMGKTHFHNDIDLNTNNMNGLQEINSSSGPNVGIHVPFYMNGHNIYGQGGSTHITDQGGTYA